MEGALAKFELAYQGPAVDNHEIDIDELYRSLSGLRDLVQRIQELVNHTERPHKINLRIAATRPGSFELGMAVADQSFATWVETLFSKKYLSVADTLALIGFTSDRHPKLPNLDIPILPGGEGAGADKVKYSSLILSGVGGVAGAAMGGVGGAIAGITFVGIINTLWDYYRHADGRPCEIREEEGRFFIINHKKESRLAVLPFLHDIFGEGYREVLNLLFSDTKLRGAASKFVSVVNSEITTITDALKGNVIINEEIAGCVETFETFVSVQKEKHVTLDVLGPQVDGKKGAWRFEWNGEIISSVKINDVEFLDQVESGAYRFGKGDTIDCILSWCQRERLGDSPSKKSFVIKKVLSFNPSQAHGVSSMKHEDST